MKIAVVGGVGYVGSNVIPELINNGHEVSVIARSSSVAKRPRIARLLEDSGAKIIVSEKVNAQLLKNVEADVYINMAGAIDKPSRALWETHVKLTEYVVEAALHYGSRVVYTSAVAAVGRLPGIPRGGEAVDGDPRSTRGIPESVYEETKARGEDVVALTRELKSKWCIVRPGLVVGRNLSHIEWRLTSMAVKARIAPSLNWEAPITHALDLAKVYLACIEGSLDGTAIHIVSYHIDIGDLVKLACRVKGLSCMKVPLRYLIRAMGPLAPDTSRIKMTYLLYRRGYRYTSLYTAKLGLPETTPEDAASIIASELLG